MRFGVLIDDIAHSRYIDTDIMLAFEAVNRGHAVWVAGIDGLSVASDTGLRASARTTTPARVFPSTEEYLTALRDPLSADVPLAVEDLDVLLLRHNPDEPPGRHPWRLLMGLRFGQLAARRGVVVLDDPDRLLRAVDKLYVLELPEEIRPRCVVSRSAGDIAAFVRAEGGPVVIKPVMGSCGRNVFLVSGPHDTNLSQMIEVAARDGYVMAQEYIPAAAQGTVRIFILEGRPLQVNGRYGALMHLPSADDHRSNIYVGGRVARAALDAPTLRAAALAGEVLAQDGLHFLTGLDMAGGKVLEVNVLTPGGMWGAERFESVRFANGVIEAAERRWASTRAARGSGAQLAR
jgi:glutathione synthase